MVVDSVLQARLPGRISAGLALEHNGVAVRQNEARPDQENTRLTERDLAVVDTD